MNEVEKVLKDNGADVVRLDRAAVHDDPIWYCKVGSRNISAVLPGGSDSPMRDVVEEEFKRITGDYPQFCFSGWGQALNEGELAAVQERNPVYADMVDEIVEKVCRNGMAEIVLEKLQERLQGGS